MANKPTPDWMATYQSAVNADPEMGVIGDWFTTDFKVSFEGETICCGCGRGRSKRWCTSRTSMRRRPFACARR